MRIVASPCGKLEHGVRIGIYPPGSTACQNTDGPGGPYWMLTPNIPPVPGTAKLPVGRMCAVFEEGAGFDGGELANAFASSYPMTGPAEATRAGT